MPEPAVERPMSATIALMSAASLGEDQNADTMAALTLVLPSPRSRRNAPALHTDARRIAKDGFAGVIGAHAGLNCFAAGS